MSTIDSDLRNLVGKYGFRDLHRALEALMHQEYEFLKGVFESEVPQVKAEVLEAPIKSEAETKKRGRKPKAEKNEVKMITVQKEPTTLIPEMFIPLDTVENTDIPTIVTEAPAPSDAMKFKDPKEQKVWQKAQEEIRRKDNESKGIQLTQVLTKENLKQWIEVEGKTYAWVAREKAGCPDTQVAATAQMMGIKSKITKKRSILMGSHR